MVAVAVGNTLRLKPASFAELGNKKACRRWALYLRNYVNYSNFVSQGWAKSPYLNCLKNWKSAFFGIYLNFHSYYLSNHASLKVCFVFLTNVTISSITSNKDDWCNKATKMMNFENLEKCFFSSTFCTGHISLRNKPSFCSGSCDKIHATTKFENKNILETPFL